VLIPRPETELLIEAALEHFERAQSLSILDVCTGSGCVAIGLGREFPRATVTASDISPEALDVASRNVARYGMGSRVRCVQADLFAGLTGPFDLIVANPPYVPSGDSPSLQPEVREFEPAQALYGGGDGLQLVRRLVREAGSRLAREGVLLFEFGVGQDEAVRALVAQTPDLTLLDIRHDLQDIPRTATLQKLTT